MKGDKNTNKGGEEEKHGENNKRQGGEGTNGIQIKLNRNRL